MYPFRLVACASKLTDLQPEMFTQCHAITDIQVNRMFMYNHYEHIPVTDLTDLTDLGIFI